MSNSKSSFSKFVLRPSSLSQHTVNFNKILEQAPLPAAESLDLKTTNNSNLKEHIETSKVDNKEQVNPKTKEEFVFGEKLSDRVVTESAYTSDNLTATTITNSSSTPSISHLGATNNKSIDNEEDSNSILNNYENDNDQESTLLKVNCKLYLLDVDKKNWTERGYGILKVIETNDKTNCKMMMWTDKCFRLILNTRIFENMSIDKATKKSIRFSGYDNGSVRIFLVKNANTSDCDELYDIIKSRVEEIQLKTNSFSIKESEHDNDAIQSNEFDYDFKSKCKLLNDTTAESNEYELSVIKNKKNDPLKDLVIVIKSSISETDLNVDLDDIEINKDSNSFIINNNQNRKYNIALSEENFRKFILFYEDNKLLNNSNNSDSSINSDDANSQKPSTKRGPDSELNVTDDKKSEDEDSDHATKKQKISTSE